MAESITGNVVGKIKFTIDKPSWDNLDKFQKKLTSVKKQMSNMHKTINVNAVTNATKKVADVTTKADKAVTEAKIKTNKQLERHFKQQQDNMLRMRKDYIKRQEQMVRGANKNAGMSDRLSWLFPSSHPTMSASKSLLAMQLREEDKLAKDYTKRRDRVVAARDKANAARRKRKSGAVNAQSAYMDSVNAFMTVKESQVRNEAIRKGFYGTDKYAENMKALQKAYADNVGLGNIKQFRANVNGVVNGMHTVQRAAEASKVTFASLRSEMVQLTAAYTAFSVAQNIVQTGFAFEGLRASAKVFAKDDAGVAEHMNFIREQAYRLGVDLKTATKEFTKFSIATKSTLSRKDQRELFVGISEYARVMGVSQQDYERAFRAVQQIECCLPTQ